MLQILPAAAAKKHIFAEKPLGIGAADAYKMADAIDAEAPLSPKKIGHVALQICSGLAAAHSKVSIPRV